MWIILWSLFLCGVTSYRLIRYDFDVSTKGYIFPFDNDPPNPYYKFEEDQSLILQPSYLKMCGFEIGIASHYSTVTTFTRLCVSPVLVFRRGWVYHFTTQTLPKIQLKTANVTGTGSRLNAGDGFISTGSASYSVPIYENRTNLFYINEANGLWGYVNFTNSCENNGTYTSADIPSTVSHCVCPTGYFGSACEYVSCVGVAHGTEVDSNKGCLCDSGYAGARCQYQMRNVTCGQFQPLIVDSRYNPTNSTCDCSARWSENLNYTVIVSRFPPSSTGIVDTRWLLLPIPENQTPAFPFRTVEEAQLTCYMTPACEMIQLFYGTNYYASSNMAVMWTTQKALPLTWYDVAMSDSFLIYGASSATYYILDRWYGKNCLIGSASNLYGNVDAAYIYVTYQQQIHSLFGCPYTMFDGSCCYEAQPTYSCPNPTPTYVDLVTTSTGDRVAHDDWTILVADFYNQYMFLLNISANYSCTNGPQTHSSTTQCIDECASSPCQNGGTCVVGTFINYYNISCTCPVGTSGDRCQFNFDDCQSNPCQNNGTCHDGINSLVCICGTGYSGLVCQTNINECQSSPCFNGASCIDGINSYQCLCMNGYSGVVCQTNTNECGSSPCLNGASCIDGINSYQCVCVNGYSGGICQTNINECQSSPCLNGASCVDGINSYQCTCGIGYSGLICQTNINECGSSPCLHGGTCVDGIASFNCICAFGFSGTVCQTDINECNSSPCRNGATCIDGVGSYFCHCANGYSGIRCETDINECTSTPCQHDGTCIDSISSYLCQCSSPIYSGLNCQISCNGHGQVNSDGECECFANYVGFNCSLPCNGRGQLISSSECECDDGFYGTWCEYPDMCITSPCQNGGTCSRDLDSYLCYCSSQYSGYNCDTVCHNRGSIVDSNCVCDSPYMGTGCEIACSGIGTLVNGVCACESRYSGTECNIECSGHGHVEQSSPESCLCDVFYSGLDCENECSGRGTIIENVCVCDTGVSGQFCEIACNGFGEVVNEKCKCSDDRMGLQCEYNILNLLDCHQGQIDVIL
jgi:hypothetical protein